MIRFSRNLSLATCLVFGMVAAAFAQMDGGPMDDGDMGEHDGSPPMLVLMPPPDAEKPEGVEMSEDPEEAFHQMFDIFFDMMDQDGNGELNPDELRGRHIYGGSRTAGPPVSFDLRGVAVNCGHIQDSMSRSRRLCTDQRRPSRLADRRQRLRCHGEALEQPSIHRASSSAVAARQRDNRLTFSRTMFGLSFVCTPTQTASVGRMWDAANSKASSGSLRPAAMIL